MIFRSALCVAAAAAALAGGDCRAIEMWTFYGDGSRIGLPSLEVPIEAYPGSPLRSDRIRARRRGTRAATSTAVRAAQRPIGTTAGGTVTLREMPAAPATVPGVPVAPEPDAVFAPRAR
ncbi:MAG: hypothetical protein ACKOSQ_02930 [Planctomycetaceae bacterium]